ncbi:hypothetical protein G3I55_13575, partial [Streptomyces sp. SID6648]|nr:hypothetical protein [Streptomyces sp. SID6648]
AGAQLLPDVTLVVPDVSPVLVDIALAQSFDCLVRFPAEDLVQVLGL